MEFNSILQSTPSLGESKEKSKKTKTILLKINQNNYSLTIDLFENYIDFRIQEKYSLYHYQNKLSYQDFSKLHKYYRFFDNLDEIYEDIIKSNMSINGDINNNQDTIKISFNVNINKNDYEINIILNKKELDKVKDIDIILSNYIMMKKELDELKNKFEINDDDLFNDSLIFQRNKSYINLIKGGIKKQLNRNIKKTNLLYRCTRDGDSCQIFHQKCDNIENTLVIGETIDGKRFGGFTTEKWDETGITKYDNFAFLFDMQRMNNYYIINQKGGIYCHKSYGPTFGNYNFFSLAIQDTNKKALQDDGNREDSYNNQAISYNYQNYNQNNYIFEGKNHFKLKDYEVFELTLI